MNEPHDDESPLWGDDGTPTGQFRRLGRDVTGQIARIVHDHNEKHRFDRTRGHRTVRVHEATTVHIDPYDYDLDEEYAQLGGPDPAGEAAWRDVDVWPTTEPERRRRASWVGVDPRLLRVGAVAAAAVVLAPVLIAVAAGGGDGDAGNLASQQEQPAAVAPQGDPATSTIPITAAVEIPITAAAVDNPADDDLADAPTSLDGVAEKGTQTAAASASAAPEPACAGRYAVVAGDYWYRISDGSGVDVAEWLAANDASLDTALYAGDELCIPEGATAPPPPRTAAPSTAAPATAAPVATEAPTTTAAPAMTAAPTTEAPATTAAPAPAPTTPPTTAVPAPPPAAPTDIESIIRSLWPDELEERALAIAWRESRYDPAAYNGWCCYGLFQIYFNVNRSFLAAQGVTSAEQLLDGYTNARVAYAMYQASGWQPWSTTDPG